MASSPPPFTDVWVPTLLVLGREPYVTYDHLLDAHRAAAGDMLEVTGVPAATRCSGTHSTRPARRSPRFCAPDELSPRGARAVLSHHVLVGDREHVVEDDDALLGFVPGHRQGRPTMITFQCVIR